MAAASIYLFTATELCWTVIQSTTLDRDPCAFRKKFVTEIAFKYLTFFICLCRKWTMGWLFILLDYFVHFNMPWNVFQNRFVTHENRIFVNSVIFAIDKGNHEGQ